MAHSAGRAHNGGVRTVFADLHIHIGRTNAGRPVKITAARDLTFETIARECAQRKGIALVGVVDCASPGVLTDIRALLQTSNLVEQPGGGFRYRDLVTILPASELETVEPSSGPSHHLCYFGTLEHVEDFSRLLRPLVTNLELSSQRCRLTAQELWRLCDRVGGLFVPAHAFTPHKSVFGQCVRRLSEMFDDRALARIPAIELGLSADTDLADRIGELADFTFLTNSDAHSVPKIARECMALRLAEPTFAEFAKALRREDGRRVETNYGLDPRLGKYHRTFCLRCERIVESEPPALACPTCGGNEVVPGVLDRVVSIEDTPEPRHPPHRPPYQYQVPLEFVPGLGPVTLNKLLHRFGSELTVLHETPQDDLARTVGSVIARDIVHARNGTLPLRAGGGGRYGKVARGKEAQLALAVE